MLTMRVFKRLSAVSAQVCLSLLGLTGLLTTVHAHQTGNSYLTVSESAGQLQLEFDFIARDLANLLPATCKPADISLLPDKLQDMQACITQALQQSLHLEIDEQDIPLNFINQTVVMHSDGLYVRQQFSGPALAKDARFLVIKYGFFTQKEQSGRAFVKIELRYGFRQRFERLGLVFVLFSGNPVCFQYWCGARTINGSQRGVCAGFVIL